jgi:predicted Zn-dependent protease with MMP-like domain
MNKYRFETVVRQAIERLPDWVHEALDNIEVLVVDEADADLDPDGEGLLGLYVGLPLHERGAEYAGELPDVIYIFRRPHLALGLSTEELREEIVRTLVHEIAHYFGFDDERLDELGWG